MVEFIQKTTNKSKKNTKEERHFSMTRTTIEKDI
jgi:hypothetical protein